MLYSGNKVDKAYSLAKFTLNLNKKMEAKKDYILPASIIVAAILIAGSIIYLVGSSKNNAGTVDNNGGQNPTAVNDAVQKQGPRDVILGDRDRIVAIEAGRTDGWWKYVGHRGLVIGIDTFGASAPAERLAEEYGLTPAKVVERVLAWKAN